MTKTEEKALWELLQKQKDILLLVSQRKEEAVQRWDDNAMMRWAEREAKEETILRHYEEVVTALGYKPLWKADPNNEERMVLTLKKREA